VKHQIEQLIILIFHLSFAVVNDVKQLQHSILSSC
jgi:hypothetical protein